jgi:hypothetical protein
MKAETKAPSLGEGLLALAGLGLILVLFFPLLILLVG